MDTTAWRHFNMYFFFILFLIICTQDGGGLLLLLIGSIPGFIETLVYGIFGELARFVKNNDGLFWNINICGYYLYNYNKQLIQQAKQATISEQNMVQKGLCISWSKHDDCCRSWCFGLWTSSSVKWNKYYKE